MKSFDAPIQFRLPLSLGGINLGWVFAIFGALLIWCVFLILFRVAWTRSVDYTFLVWNLALAFAPLFFAVIFNLQRNAILRFGCGAAWLLFLPNAPYIITDFMHLRVLDSGPIWLDILLLASCAATGLGMGYYSLVLIHDQFQASQKQIQGWFLAITALFLCGFGIYLGRFLRWRSIDIVANPLSLLSDVIDRFIHPLTHYRTWGVTLGFGTFLIIGYILFRTLRTRGTTT